MVEENNKNLRKVEFADLIQKYMADYGTAVNLDRAIPSLIDGLKPVQRRILWTSYLNKLGSKSKHMKVDKLRGQVLTYHAHGPTSVENAIVTMAQDWKMRVPLIDIQGNKGDISGNGAAAGRYIECRMTTPGELMLKDIDKDIVPMVANYDNTEKEPFYLPSALPNALTNFVQGIGYGLATNIAPHNPIELLKAAIALVDDPKLSTEKLFKIIPGPDFPTGGEIIGYQPSIDEINTGKATYTIRGKMHTEVEKEGRKKQYLIVVDEVPFGVTTTQIVEQIGKVLQDNPNLNAVEVGDESIDGKLRLVAYFKSDEFLEDVKNLIWKYTDMETKYSVSNMMIDDGRPKLISIKYYLKKWSKNRKKILTKSLNYDANKTNKRLNFVSGFIKMYENADEIIKCAKNSNNKAELVKVLKEKYDFNEEQANAIANLPIYRLGKQDIEALKTEFDNLNKQLEEISYNLNNIDEYFKKDMENVIEILEKDEKINTDRKTKLVKEVKKVNINLNKIKQETIPEKDAFVTIRDSGVIQRMTPRVFDNNIEEAKQSHNIISEIKTKTNDFIMIFTDDGGVITRLVNELPDVNPKFDGDDLHKQIPDFKTEHRILNATNWNDDIAKENKLVFSLTKEGLCKLSELNKSMANTNTRRYFSRMTTFNGLKKRDDGDQIILTLILSEEDVKNKKIVVTLENDKIIEQDLSDITIQNPTGSGAAKMKRKGLEKFKSYELIDK